jgi:hypothetical protein
MGRGIIGCPPRPVAPEYPPASTTPLPIVLLALTGPPVVPDPQNRQLPNLTLDLP